MNFLYIAHFYNSRYVLIFTHCVCHKMVLHALRKDRRSKFHRLARYAVVHDQLERALAQKCRTVRDAFFEIFRSGLKGQETVRDGNYHFLT